MLFNAAYGAQLDMELGSADRSILFTTARRKQAINDAMHNFERITSCTPVYGTIPLLDGVGEYDLFLTFPNYISLQERGAPAVKTVDPAGNVAWFQGDSLPQRDPVWLDRETPGWRADPKGTPLAWYLREDAGTTWVGLDPAPAVTAGWTRSLLVPYLASSDDLVSDGDVPFSVNGKSFARLIPYHQGLVHYAAGLLEPLRKNYSAVSRQMSVYAGYVAQYMTKTRRDGPDQVTFARNYLADATRPNRPVDTHRWP
jgi:hypothetical protein